MMQFFKMLPGAMCAFSQRMQSVIDAFPPMTELAPTAVRSEILAVGSMEAEG